MLTMLGLNLDVKLDQIETSAPLDEYRATQMSVALIVMYLLRVVGTYMSGKKFFTELNNISRGNKGVPEQKLRKSRGRRPGFRKNVRGKEREKKGAGVPEDGPRNCVIFRLFFLFF